MRFKLDENLGRRGSELLTMAGHDVATIHDQDLTNAEDVDVIGVCRRENRCLITLDLDFANPLLFKPSEYCGIAVLRLPAKPSRDDLLGAIRTLARAIETESLRAQLWIVEIGRIRIYRPDA